MNSVSTIPSYPSASLCFGTTKKTNTGKPILSFRIEIDPTKPREAFKIKQDLKHRYCALPQLSDKEVAANRFNLKNWKEWKKIRNIMTEGLQSCNSPGEKIWYCASPLVQWGLDALLIGFPFIIRILTRDVDFVNISPALKDFNQAMHIVHANRISAASKKACDNIEAAYQAALHNTVSEKLDIKEES